MNTYIAGEIKVRVGGGGRGPQGDVQVLISLPVHIDLLQQLDKMYGQSMGQVSLSQYT